MIIHYLLFELKKHMNRCKNEETIASKMNKYHEEMSKTFWAAAVKLSNEADRAFSS